MYLNNNGWSYDCVDNKSDLRGGKTKCFDFFFEGVTATKSFARARILRYGLFKDILSKGQNI